MRIITAQAHTAAFWVTNRPRRDDWHATLIVKASYRLVAGGIAVPDDAKAPVACGDEPADPSLSPRYASDFVPFKPKADFLVVGAAYAAAGKPVTRCRVAIAIGAHGKTLAVTGNRHWIAGPLGVRPSEPEPFVTMPIGYEQAYGGAGIGANPVGCGADPRPGQKLPNILLPHGAESRAAGRPQPAGFGPLAVSWQPRVDRSGTYDTAWLKDRWPWFPRDFNWSFFNAAPDDQQFAYFRGDETLAFENLHPEHASYRSRLPGVRARMFVERTCPDRPDEATAFEEVAVNLDTVWVDLPEERLVMLWRGATPVRSPRLREIAAICATLEPLDAPLDIEAHRANFAALKGRIGQPREARFDAMHAEIARLRQGPEAQRAAARATAAQVRGIADAARQSAGPDKQRRRLAPATEDPMETLRKGIATLKAQDPAKGQLLEDRLAAVDGKLGEALNRGAGPSPWTRERVVDACAKGESLAKAKLDGLDLARLDLAGADFRDATFAGTTLRDARLEGANLAGANFGNATLTGVSFIGADLSRANLTDAIIGITSFAGARLDRTILARLDLEGEDFSGASGKAADFTEALLDGARFVSATLERCRFTAVSAVEANFADAVLQATDFSGARAPRIIMQGATLANLRAGRGADFSGGNFRQIRAPQSVWQQSVLDGADFSRAVLTRAQFAEASLRGACFDRAHLQHAIFDDAALARAQLSNANLLRASFERADLTDTRLDGSNLYGAWFLDSLFERTTVQGSFIAQTLLRR